MRGGFGMFFDTPNANPFLDNRPNNNAPNGVEGNPGGPEPVYTVATYGVAVVPGQYIFPVVTPTTTNLCNPASPCGVFSVNRNFKTPITSTTACKLSKSLGSHMLFQIGYVGSEGRQLLSLLNINQPFLGGPTTDRHLPKRASIPVVTQRPYLGQYPQYGDINQIESIGTSNYNSLQTIFSDPWLSWSEHTIQLYLEP